MDKTSAGPRSEAIPDHGTKTLEPLAVTVDPLPLELAASKDRYLRLAADFDNYRKRTTQESLRRGAEQKEALIAELLPVIDNLERALEVNQSASLEQLRLGVEMIWQQLRQILCHHEIEPEESLGQPFDALRHQAIATSRDPTKPDQSILKTTQRGYRRGQQVFRPAAVIVNDLSI